MRTLVVLLASASSGVASSSWPGNNRHEGLADDDLDLRTRSATVTGSVPLAMSASRINSFDANFPVPTSKRDANSRSAIFSFFYDAQHKPVASIEICFECGCKRLATAAAPLVR